MSNDYFVRQRVDYLTGLTKMKQKVGASTPLADDEWTTIYAEAATPVHQILKAYKIELGADVGAAELRILAAASDAPGTATDSASNKTFPFGDSTEVLSGVDMHLDFPLQVPVAHEFFIQIKAPGIGVNFIAIMSYLSVITVPPLNAT